MAEVAHTSEGNRRTASDLISNADPILWLSLIGVAIVAAVFAFDKSAGVIAFALLGTAALVPAIRYMPREPSAYIGLMVAATALNYSDVLTDRYGFTLLGKAIIALPVLALIYQRATAKWRIAVDPLSIEILIVYFLLAAISAIWAFSPAVTIDAADGLLRDMMIGVLVLIATQRFTHVRFAALAFLAAVVLMAALGTLTFSLGIPWENIAGLTGSTFDYVAEGDRDTWRLTGPYTDPNPFARVLIVGFPFAVYEFIRTGNKLYKIALLGMIGILLTAVLFTGSRGALLGVIAMVAVGVWQQRRRLLRVFLYALPAAALLVFFVPQEMVDRSAGALAVFKDRKSERILEEADVDNSTTFRLHEMMIATDMFRDHPILGVGYSNYPELFQKYQQRGHYVARHENRQPHSLVLQIAAEQGVLGLATFAALFAVCCYQAFSTASMLRRSHPKEAELANMVGIAIVGFLTSSLVLHEIYARSFWILVGLALALPVCGRALLARPPRTSNSG